MVGVAVAVGGRGVSVGGSGVGLGSGVSVGGSAVGVGVWLGRGVLVLMARTIRVAVGAGVAAGAPGLHAAARMAVSSAQTTSAVPICRLFVLDPPGVPTASRLSFGAGLLQTTGLAIIL
jgi:hypothetical protein